MTVHACRISTKELLQCVFLIISNCLWNEFSVAITTVTNRAYIFIYLSVVVEDGMGVLSAYERTCNM